MMLVVGAAALDEKAEGNRVESRGNRLVLEVAGAGADVWMGLEVENGEVSVVAAGAEPEPNRFPRVDEMGEVCVPGAALVKGAVNPLMLLLNPEGNIPDNRPELDVVVAAGAKGSVKVG